MSESLDTFITPHQFSIVEDGLYRGSYPTLRHFRFLECLKLKTIISLIPEPPTKDLQAFCQLLGIKIIHFQISRLAPLNHPNLQKKLVQAISAILVQSSPSSSSTVVSSNTSTSTTTSTGGATSSSTTPTPISVTNSSNTSTSSSSNNNNKAIPAVRNIYVHCLDGRRITGLMVLLLRRLQNYSPDFSYSEFWSFQLPAIVPYQEELRMNREFDRFVNEINEDFILPSEGLPRYLWDGESCKVFPPGLKVTYSSTVKTPASSLLSSAASSSVKSVPEVSSVNVHADDFDGKSHGQQSKEEESTNAVHTVVAGGTSSISNSSGGGGGSC